MVAEAHAAGVGVESEIENIVGVEDGVGSDEATHSYSNEKLVEVATDTGTDLLAPALGTAHGLYKASPVLQYDRVAELGRLTDKPVVLHGGTGLSPEDFQRFIDNGVAKINISTTVKLAYMHAARTTSPRPRPRANGSRSRCSTTSTPPCRPLSSSTSVSSAARAPRPGWEHDGAARER